MTRLFLALLALTPLAGPAAAAAPSVAAPSVAAPSVAAMTNHRRVLIVASPSAGDARLARQRRALAGWRGGARDRDVSVVEVIGDRVHGASDRARPLRRRWRLPPGDFQVVLVGKDGHEALRAGHPLAAARMQRTIDAMPMRRAGRR